jgi:hypothetical protein
MIEFEGTHAASSTRHLDWGKRARLFPLPRGDSWTQGLDEGYGDMRLTLSLLDIRSFIYLHSGPRSLDASTKAYGPSSM